MKVVSVNKLILNVLNAIFVQVVDIQLHILLKTVIAYVTHLDMYKEEQKKDNGLVKKL